MKKIAINISSLVVILFAISCKSDTTNHEQSKETMKKDPHSFARPSEAVAQHLDLDITVDFEKKTISGKSSYVINNKSKGDEIVFDTHKLNIEKVTIGEEEKETTYSLGNEDPILGQALIIKIAPETERVNIYYSTSPSAEALQWQEPSQTAGKEHPFLFTQSQAILARTWLPCQDGPGMRYTYNATVKVPSDLLALMSAENPTEKNNEGIYHFTMNQPVPSYLMALAVGDFAYKSVGERTGVYAEPVMLDKSVYEFAEMEDMLIAAEKLYGPYAWEQYDLIVLPPSFPFGGMENPRLTFATPTIIAGDRSLTALVAHELAHSWSGNLVTNDTWNDFWLNEGFTVYFERRIMESLYGKDYADMLAVLGHQDLGGDIEELDPKDTHLKLELDGRNPDDGMTDIAYEKGYFFLRLIEETVGREKFDAFLKGYFTTNAFKTMNTEDFIVYINENLLQENQSWSETIQLDKWIYGPGMPDNAPKVVSTRFQKVDTVMNNWLNKETTASQLDTSNWTSHEWLHFIRQLPKTITGEQMAELDQAFNLTNSGNNEILAAWFEHTISHQYTAADGALRQFLVTVGRRKFLVPLYSALASTESGMEMARDIYSEARSGYHSVSYNTIDGILKMNKTSN